MYCVCGGLPAGKLSRINASAPELLYRSDFFPGLGWMITDRLWDELRDKWPKSYVWGFYGTAG